MFFKLEIKSSQRQNTGTRLTKSRLFKDNPLTPMSIWEAIFSSCVNIINTVHGRGCLRKEIRYLKKGMAFLNKGFLSLFSAKNYLIQE